MPADISEYLPKRFDWVSETNIGGHWDWDRAPTRTTKTHGCYAGIAVHQPRRTAEDMRLIDAALDDGDLDTGIFRRKSEGYIYILEL